MSQDLRAAYARYLADWVSKHPQPTVHDVESWTAVRALVTSITERGLRLTALPKYVPMDYCIGVYLMGDKIVEVCDSTSGVGNCVAEFPSVESWEGYRKPITYDEFKVQHDQSSPSDPDQEPA